MSATERPEERIDIDITGDTLHHSGMTQEEMNEWMDAYRQKVRAMWAERPEERWRTGRKLGHTVYAMVGDEPSDADRFLFTTHDVALAESIVAEHNGPTERPEERIDIDITGDTLHHSGMTQEEANEWMASYRRKVAQMAERLGEQKNHVLDPFLRLRGAGCLAADAVLEALGIYRIVDWLARRLP